MVAPLSDAEWQLFLQWLPSCGQPELLRAELDQLMRIYLGKIEAEACSPFSREVATILSDIARHARSYALYLHALDSCAANEGAPLNSAAEAAVDVLAYKKRSALETAIWANEVLATDADREAKSLEGRVKKGKRTHGEPTTWTLWRLAELLRDHGLNIPSSLKQRDPFFSLSMHFLKVAKERAKSLPQLAGAVKEIDQMLMITKPVFLKRLRQASQQRTES